MIIYDYDFAVNKGVVCPDGPEQCDSNRRAAFDVYFGVAFRLCACMGEWAKVLCPAASFAGVYDPQTKDVRKRTMVSSDGNVRAPKGVCPLKFHRRKVIVMKKTRFCRLIAFLLAVMLLIGANAVTVGASSASDSVSSLDKIREKMSAISYKDYQKNNGSVGAATGENVVVSALDNVYFNSNADGKERGDLVSASSPASPSSAHFETAEGVNGLYVPSNGKVTWVTDRFAKNVDANGKYVPKKYTLEIVYYSSMDVDAFGNRVEASKATSIERIFKINGTAPFSEARYMTVPKTYENMDVYGWMEITEDMDVDTMIADAKTAGLEAERAFNESTKREYIRYKMPKAWDGTNSAFVTDQNKEDATDAPVRFFIADIDGNEIRTTSEAVPTWATYEFKDSNGFYQTPFEFVIEPDENGNVEFTLEAVNECFIISEIRFLCPKTVGGYEAYRQNIINAKGYQVGSGSVKVEAEYFTKSSSQTIYPISDTTSAVNSPISTDAALLNTLGGDKWQTPGQWIEYRFTVSENGFYQLVPRFKQAILDGMYVSRILYLYSDGALTKGQPGYYDGVPFAEATKLNFNYSSDWQAEPLNDGTTEFEFYFEKGVTYTMRFEVSLGTMGDVVNTVQASLESINADYLNILKLTGSNPDEYRDYKFRQVMPETVYDLLEQAEVLQGVVDDLENKAGVTSSMVATLEKVIRLLDTMGSSDDDIAKNLEQLKTYIGSLGTWISDAKTQPLLLDFVSVQPTGAELPKANAGFWEGLWHEIVSFFKSFFRNYDRMGAMSETQGDGEEIVEVWLAYGRDQTQVIRGLINNDFTPQYGDPVNLKLVAGGTLLPSILSGMGPDVYIGLGQGDVINYAIRGALLPIEHMEDTNPNDKIQNDYATVEADFNEAAMIVMQIRCAGEKGKTEEHKDCGSGVLHCYGLPETQGFSMMFVREDILADLDIDIPETWDDIKEAIPVLQANNMQIGMQKDAKIFLYQQDGELFADEGMRVNLDSNLALESFNTMCDMFTMYSFPYQFDFANRFRTGEMPIGFAAYTGTYNQLKVFATEIEGLWGFYPMPGYYNEETGKINQMSVSSCSAIVMITGCENQKGAWNFMSWHAGADCQVDYSNEMVAILGPSAKHSTANETALESMPWTRDELKQLKIQFDQLASIPNYPGNYIIDRYINFAFLEAYNDKADPTLALQSYISIINKEITRKRQEFGLETLEAGQTLAQKRMAEAEALLNEAKKSASYSNAYANTVENALKLISGYETEDFASIQAVASALKKQNADLFGASAAKLEEAAYWLTEYEKSK